MIAHKGTQRRSFGLAWALAAYSLLEACAAGGAGGSPAGGFAPMEQFDPVYEAVLRYSPTQIDESLASAQAQYVYVDSMSSNGSYPEPAAFMTQFATANPGVLAGACSKIATLSDTVIEQSAGGVEAPTVVIAVYPVATGTCSQTLQLGAEGQGVFEVMVTQ